MCLMETEWMEEGEAETGDICILFFSNVAPLSWEVPDAFIKFFSRKKLDFTKNRIRKLCVLWKNMAGFCSFKTRDIGKRMVEQLFGCCFSIAQSCLTLQPHNSSTPGFPVLHRLWELAQIHVGWVSDDIQPSHPLSPSPPAFNLYQHFFFSLKLKEFHNFFFSSIILKFEMETKTNLLKYSFSFIF